MNDSNFNSIRGQFVIGGKPSTISMIMSALTLILILVGIFYLIKGAYWLLGILAPVLLIITLIIDYKVVLNYGKFILGLLKTNILGGLVGILLTVAGAPFVAGFLFAKAMLKRSIKKAINKTETKGYTDYEIVDKKDEDEDFLQLPPLKKEAPKTNETNEYEGLF